MSKLSTHGNNEAMFLLMKKLIMEHALVDTS